MIDSNDPQSGESRPVVVVTGGSSGIGKATASRFLSEGWHTLICGRDAARLELAVEDILQLRSSQGATSEQARLEWQVADIRSRTELNQLVDRAVNDLGRVDVWVNNAGAAPLGPVESLSDEDLDVTLQTNVAPIFLSTRALWPVFRDQGRGVMINISSLAATDPFSGFSLYGASKAWVNLFTKAVAEEGKADGIHVYAVCPGAVETPLLRKLFPDFPAEQTLGPEQVAESIWHLCQKDHDIPSGTAIEISAQ